MWEGNVKKEEDARRAITHNGIFDTYISNLVSFTRDLIKSEAYQMLIPLLAPCRTIVRRHEHDISVLMIIRGISDARGAPSSTNRR